MTILILLIAAFVALSGLMAAVDAALLSVTMPEVHELVIKKKSGAQALRSLKSKLTPAVVVIVILANTINVLGPIVVSQHAVSTFGPGVLGAITVVLAIGTIVFSEIIPKAVGTRYAPTISRLAAFPVRILQTLFYPLIFVLEGLSRFFTSGQRRIGTEEQIRSLTTIGRRAGFIEQDEGRMIHRAFVLNDKTAADIMTPLDRVVSIRASDTIEEAAAKVKPARYSRFPVFGDSPNDVVGIALIRDLLEAAAEGRRHASVQTIVRPVVQVTSDTRSDALLLIFRRRHIHMAIVTDASKTVGVVTLENVLEELVGEIEDERDVEVTRNAGGSGEA